MNGLKVGHFTSEENRTGVSVFLFEDPSVGAYQLCGSGPASHELMALDSETSTPYAHALVLSGGSAYGLYASSGVMQFLTERGVGLPLPHGVVPIVPAAAIYDLNYAKAVAPSPKDAYQACLSAKLNNTLSGRIGAGTGATVGKLIPEAKRMTGGLGYAALTLKNHVQVEAYVVVNAVGDIRDGNGKIVAGARDLNRGFANCESYILAGEGGINFYRHTNTTLAVVFTNAKFSQSELKRISKMGIAGMARAISPVFTCFDGDILFSFSLGDEIAPVMSVGVMAAEAVRLAILDAVKDSVTVV